MHYHGTPITPKAKLLELAGRSFCVRFGEHRQVEVCHQIGQSVMLDNGAFPAWRRGASVNWQAYYEWCDRWLAYQTTWAVIPDVITGSEADNDALIAEWPFGHRGAPVWHLHESIGRLMRLSDEWSRVCLGSSGEYAEVGDPRWHARMGEAMDALCGDGPAPVWLHMLRGMKLAGSRYPFASADSTNIARNHNGNNTRSTPRKDVNEMADRLDAKQCPAVWVSPAKQLDQQQGGQMEASETSAINAPHPDDEPSSDDLEGFFDPPSEEDLTEEFQAAAAEPDPAALPDLTPEQAKAEGEAYREEKEGVEPEHVQQLREIPAQKPEEPAAAEPEQISVAGTAPASEQSRQQEREYIVFQQVPLTEKVLKGLLESLPSDGTPRVAYFELHRAEARNVNGAVSTAYETHKDALGNKCDLAAVTDRAWQTRHVEVKPITETQLAIS